MLSDYLSATSTPTLPVGHRTCGKICSFHQGRQPSFPSFSLFTYLLFLLPLRHLLVAPVVCRSSPRICVTSEGLFYVLEAATFLTLAITRGLSPFIRRSVLLTGRNLPTYLPTYARAREKEREGGYPRTQGVRQKRTRIFRRESSLSSKLSCSSYERD